ncbi:MAG: hypothetical protein HWD89_05520 [Tenacibaculum sp.]|uniref:hypothetical protein n=1 Tax=unclassified Tenacibaculum TaxID=2635139 RepID=UPI0017C75A50|nr:hypothetical protein [Tenacibaculum sp.]NVK08491.1 hypothetical protein [Tenacibaculum sp.]
MHKPLQDLLSDSKLNRKEKVLVLLAHDDSSVKKVSEIKVLAVTNGLREIEKWNISMVLKSLNGLAIKVKDGWCLTTKGEAYLVDKNFQPKKPKVVEYVNLKTEAEKIKSTYVKEFVIEAIDALEYDLLKSAVVFSWIGAISVMYEHIINNRLVDFNKEAKRRFPKWKSATNIDGLTRMKEYDFLQVLESLSVFGKNTKNELEQCLKLRNSCGHPSTLKIGGNRVSAHLEILILNIYKKY